MNDRPKKRSRRAITDSTAGPSKPTPRLFAPFRALGLVCDHVPCAMFVHTPRGALARPTVNIVTSVGRSWMMWDAASMTLVFVGESRCVRRRIYILMVCLGPDAGAEIRSLQQTGTEVFASAGKRVIKYHRGKEVGSQLLGRTHAHGDNRRGAMNRLTERCSERFSCLASSCSH